MKFLVLNGPNLNLLGQREPGIYGENTYESLCRRLEEFAAAHGSTADCIQSNHEGALIDAIHAAQGKYDAIVMNPGAYTHYSYAILDALKAVDVPCIEVHISNVHQREEFRHKSVTAPACGMACILPCVILITGVTGPTRYYYAAARIIETIVGLLIALAVNAALPDHRPEAQRGEADMKVEVDNNTKKLCVIGDPVLHSKSPLLHNTMLRELGLDYVYLCQPVPRGRCREWLDCAKFAGYAGFNATMPHKEELVPLMDELDGDAALIGAVNTVCIRDGKAYGYNTDGEGFLRSLADEGIHPAGRRVMVLGAGGAAKAVCLKLAQAGASVTVCNRTLDKAEAICAHDPAHLRAAGFDAATLYKEAQGCGLLVNCTSLGMEGTQGQFEDFSFLDGLAAGVPVVDLIYAPAQTELLRQAARRGHKTVNGYGLLVNQAVLALEHFTGTAIDAARMKQVLSGLV